jgi:hypothetical protein
MFRGLCLVSRDLAFKEELEAFLDWEMGPFLGQWSSRTTSSNRAA